VEVPSPVHVSVVGNPGAPVLVILRGNLDVDSATVLSTSLDQAFRDTPPCVVVDLSGIEFCDSTGLSEFVTGHNRAVAAGGWLRLAAPAPFLDELLETVGLTSRIGVYATVGDALADRDAL
jgi:anti-sigma B factor antagonist